MRPSSVRAFLGSVEGLCLIEAALRRALGPFKRADLTDETTLYQFTQLTAAYLRVSEACDRKLRTDVAVRREYEELAQMLEAGLTDEELEQTFEVHFARKGWGNLDYARDQLRNYLVDCQGLDPEQADEVVRDGLPARTVQSRRPHPTLQKMRKSHGRMDAALAEAADDLEEALASSEEVPDTSDTGTTTDDGRPSSDEDGTPEGDDGDA